MRCAVSEPVKLRTPDIDFHFDRRMAADVKMAIAKSDLLGDDLPLAETIPSYDGPSSPISDEHLEKSMRDRVWLMARFANAAKRGRNLHTSLKNFREAIEEWTTFVNRPPPAPEPEPPEIIGTVYFIRVGAFVKIGYTGNLASRVKSLSTASATPPVVIHSEPGTNRDERGYHHRFADLRENGEWFRLEGPLADYLENIGGKAG